MKINIYIILIGILLSSCPNASYGLPINKVDNYVDLFFRGSSSLSWQSNLFFQDDNEQTDFISVTSPSLEAAIGNRLSGFNALVLASYNLQRFTEASELNRDFLNLSLNGSYDGARLDLNASLSYSESQSAAGQSGSVGGGFVETNVTNFRLGVDYILSPRFSFGSGLGYSENENISETNRNPDVESFSIPFDILYELTPKIDLILGYNYTLNDTEAGAANEGFETELHNINVGTSGYLLPKLRGSARIGFSYNNPEGESRESDEIVSLSADLTHSTTPKLNTLFGLNRQFSIGSEGQNVVNTSANINFSYSISSAYSANASASLSYQEFQDGNAGDDFIYRAGFSVSYSSSEYWSFNAGYSYDHSDSDRGAGLGFVNHSLNASASLRF